MEQTREMQLAQLYDILGFRRVIAHYDVVSRLYETSPCTQRTYPTMRNPGKRAMEEK